MEFQTHPHVLAKSSLHLFLILLGSGLTVFSIYPPRVWADLTHLSFNALGDEILAMWIMDRLSENLLTHPLSLFDGKIFYPLENTLAFAENLFIPSLFYRLIYTGVGEKLLSYHLCVALMASLNFVSMYLMLTRRLSLKASFVGGLIFSASMLRLAQLSHIQLFPQFFTPWAIYYFYLWSDSHSIKIGLRCALCFTLQLYCSFYLGILLVVSVLPWWLMATLKKPSASRLPLRSSLLMWGVVGVCFLPLMAPYLWVSQTYNLERKLGDSRSYGTNEMSFLSSPPESIYYKMTSPLQRGGDQHEKHLFLGFLVLLLAIYGGREFQKREHQVGRFEKRVLWVSLFFVVWISMGPNAGLYSLFYYVFPLLKAIRVPARFGFIYLFIMAALAAYGFEKLSLKVKSLALRRLWLGGVLALFFIENKMNIRFVPFPTRLSVTTPILNGASQPGPVAYLPLTLQGVGYEGDQGNRLNNREAVRMVHSLSHHRPILNGYSGFVPEVLRSFQDVEARFGLSTPLLEKFFNAGYAYLVIDKHLYAQPARQVIAGMGRDDIAVVFEDENFEIVELRH